MDLIERLIDDPNSSFKAEDAAELEKLSPEVLQRMAVGLQTKPAAVSEDQERVEALRADLSDCQKDILELVATEKELRDELSEFEEVGPSVLERFVPVLNSAQEAQQAPLTEEGVMDFVKNSKSVTGVVLREALAARDVSRAKAIDVIITNSKVFTEAELRAKFTPELVKLAEFVQQSKPAPVESAVFNYEGVGLADQSVNQTTAYSYGGALDLPTTFR